VDWDKLRIFHAAAKVGSFTHAGAMLGLSQSAVSRQVSALEADLQVPLFHRHARGLILTEQGEVLYRTVQDVMAKLDQAKTRLSESRERPNGDLRITTNVAIGTGWLTPRLGEFLDLYPEIRLHLILTDEELDLGMRAADVALRLREPIQPDLIRRRLFTVHYHLYASVDYVKSHGQPRTIEDLDHHRLISYDVTASAASYLDDLNAPLHIGRDAKHPRVSALAVTNIIALQKAVLEGVGIGVLPDYLRTSQIVQILTDAVTPELECYLVYPEEMKSVARIQVFRDFLVSSAQRWNF